MSALYPYLYLGMLASAMLWYMLNESNHSNKRLAKIAFFASMGLYLPAMAFADGGIFYKALVAGRDLAILGGLIILTNALLSKPKMLFAMVVLSLLGIKFFYMDVLSGTFKFNEGLAQDAELLIDLRSPRLMPELEEVIDEYDLSLQRAFPDLEHDEYSELDDFYSVNIPDKYADRLDEIMEALLATNALDVIDENELVQLSPQEGEEIADSRISYGINDPIVGKLWGFERMDVASFYKLIREKGVSPKRRAKIAILDTGVDVGHEDLKGNYRSIDSRYDSDKQGHGTHCAGIAGAVSNNGTGIASLALSEAFVSISSVKVLSDEGRGSQQSIVQGIIRAADAGVDVISMSLGGPRFGRAHKAYEEAIAYANKAGAIVVVAAGNSNENASDYVPASCKGVIAVSALDEDMSRASFSNWVTDMEMGIAAPGVNVMSTFPDNKYVPLSGTSMATPYVAGLLGIMKAMNPNLTTAEAYKILKETGVETKDTNLTGKFIQPAKVLERLLKE